MLHGDQGECVLVFSKGSKWIEYASIRNSQKRTPQQIVDS